MSKQHDFCQVSLKVFLTNDKKETLILKSLDNGVYKGFYDLPGGRIDQDEFSDDLEKIIRREIKEEVGDLQFKLNLKPIGFSRIKLKHKESPIGGSVHVVLIFFAAKYQSGQVKISPEHQGFEWVSLNKENIKNLFVPALAQGAFSLLEYLKNN